MRKHFTLDEIKKPFYKRWWFITLVVLFLIGIIFKTSEEDRAKTEEERIAEAERKNAEELEKQREKEEKAAEKLATKEQKELEKAQKDAEKQQLADEKALAKAEEEKQKELDKTAEDAEKEKEAKKKSIKKSAEKIIKQDLNGTTITNVDVNENMAKDGGTYIVLPHLVWDVKNGAKSTREMLEMYSDHLSAKLAEEKDVDEITVFWEVPSRLEDLYLFDDEGISKKDYITKKRDIQQRLENIETEIFNQSKQHTPIK